MDRGYLNLLGELRRQKPTLPFNTIYAAICHYLIQTPAPTPLVASVVASPLWHPLTLRVALELGSTFRSAVALPQSTLEKEQGNLFGGAQPVDFDSWLRCILDGLDTGDALVRLALSGGVLLGLHDLKRTKRLMKRTEECFVVSFTELLDASAIRAPESNWEREFTPGRMSSGDRLRLALLIASQYFPIVSESSLSALDLSVTSISCMNLIQDAFAQGTFLSETESSAVVDDNGLLRVQPSSPLTTALENLIQQDAYSNIASLCKLLGRCFTILSENTSNFHRVRVWELLADVHDSLEELVCTFERNWQNTPFVNVQDEEKVEPNSREATTKLWMILKTLLFSTVMIQQSILSTILYLPPTRSSSWSSGTPRTLPSAPQLSSSILKTLAALSFVIAQFGGVLAGAGQEAGEGPVFPQLKRVFYTAIDILTSDKTESESSVTSLVNSLGTSRSPFHETKRAYCLACVEQVIPVLSDDCIRSVVLKVCEPCLSDPSHRESYESAHSVMLAIFAAHANKPSPHSTGPDGKSPLAEMLVPGYAKLLLDNARDGKLTTLQFRLAYAALVRSASKGRSASVVTRGNADQNLAWLCVSELLKVLRSLPRQSAAGKGREGIEEERERLQMTLVALSSNVTLLLLPRVLEEIDATIRQEPKEERKRTLIQALFDEILDRVGDGEKEFSIHWWHTHYGQKAVKSVEV